jgi:hypothetical protein
MKHVDLNVKPRSTVEIEIGDKTYKISRVVNGVRIRWIALLEEWIEYLEKSERLIGLQQEAEKEEKKEATEQIRTLTVEIEEWNKQKIERTLECIRLLLEKNGYEFDRQWWLDNCDDMDYRYFIEEAMKKDAPAGGQKKTESPTGEE